MTKNKEIDNILDIIEYGTEWLEGGEESSSYKIGSYETLGFIVACLICQRLKKADGVPTSDTIEWLELNVIMSREKRKTLLVDYIKELS